MHINDLETPALLVDSRVLNANIKRMADDCKLHKIALRACVSTHKSPMIAYKQIAAGACGIACQKLSEAEVFADASFDDILIPSNIVGNEKLNRLMQLARRVPVSVTVDSRTVAEGISQAAKQAGLCIPILIKMDTGGSGYGTQTTQGAVELGKQIVNLPNADLAGLMTCPSRPTSHLSIVETLNHFKAAGIPINVVSSVGILPFQAHEIPAMSELCAGTYVFYDVSHINRRVCRLEECASTILVTVVSTPTPGRVILDAGAKTLTRNACLNVSLTGGRKAESVFGVIKDCPDAFLDGLSEEHGHLNTANATRQFKVGDKVRIIPVDAWAVTSINDTFALVTNDRVVEILPIAARGKVY